MKYFAIITGIATLISFVIGLKDIFPQYSVYVNNISYILLGLVVGNVISLFDKSKIEVYRFKSTHLFVYIFYLVIAIVTLVLLLVKDGLEMKVLGSIGTFVVVTLFMLKSLLHEASITITERMTLSEIHTKNGNYSEAIWHLREAKDLLGSEDSRIKSINKKIKDLKNKQITDTKLLTNL